MGQTFTRRSQQSTEQPARKPDVDAAHKTVEYPHETPAIKPNHIRCTDIMEEVTLDELVKRFNVLDERLDEPCIDSYLIAIAIYLTTWKTAAPRLGLKQAEIEAIESDARSTEEMRQKTLQKWADKFAHKATYRRLITVFLEVGDAKLASKACELLSCRQCTYTVPSENESCNPEDSVVLPLADSVVYPSDESGLRSLSSTGDLGSPSPTEATFLQAGNTSTSILPYLKTHGLNDAQTSALKGKLIRESRQIMLKFNKLLQNTIKSLKQQGVTPEELVTSLMCLETMIGDQQLPLFHEREERMAQQGSIDSIFRFISGYISFINCDVIEHIIESHGTETDVSNLKGYKAELKEYCKRRVSECPHKNYAEPCMPGYTPIVIKLDRHLNKCKLLDVDLFREELSRILQVHSHTLVFLKVEEGCTQLTFQIPSFIVDLVFPLSREQEEALKEERVIKLVCGAHVYPYPLKGSINEPSTVDLSTTTTSVQENVGSYTSMDIDTRSDLTSSVLGTKGVPKQKNLRRTSFKVYIDRGSNLNTLNKTISELQIRRTLSLGPSARRKSRQRERYGVPKQSNLRRTSSEVYIDRGPDIDTPEEKQVWLQLQQPVPTSSASNSYPQSSVFSSHPNMSNWGKSHNEDYEFHSLPASLNNLPVPDQFSCLSVDQHCISIQLPLFHVRSLSMMSELTDVSAADQSSCLSLDEHPISIRPALFDIRSASSISELQTSRRLSLGPPARSKSWQGERYGVPKQKNLRRTSSEVYIDRGPNLNTLNKTMSELQIRRTLSLGPSARRKSWRRERYGVPKQPNLRRTSSEVYVDIGPDIDTPDEKQVCLQLQQPVPTSFASSTIEEHSLPSHVSSRCRYIVAHEVKRPENEGDTRKTFRHII